ncbi:MAG: hypothetical protein LAT68_11960 [Cyclobacteriaceae bacterium]|nr:hypothetical protein [Cyclobacteriaceae bacterium]MCH8517031.1 hypothetical protein [Cyclobacteriaceae bacterium]
MEAFDIVFLGAGCSTRHLLYELYQQPDFKKSRVLLIDDGSTNDRTWCYWTENKTEFHHLENYHWKTLEVGGKKWMAKEEMSSLTYHYLAGKDFFQFMESADYNRHPNFEIKTEKVDRIDKDAKGEFKVITNKGEHSAKKVYSSLPPKIKNVKNHILLWQHFKGWTIKTEKGTFDTKSATLMDFSVSYNDKFCFMYVLPFSDDEALVELTFFSNTIYEDAVYESIIEDYCQQKLGVQQYQILSTEKGKIPMTNYPLKAVSENGVINIGTSAGMMKASTGYGFLRMKKDAQLLATGENERRITKGRFKFYDQLLLYMLRDNPLEARNAFQSLFKNNPMERILTFLDENTTLKEEISIFLRLPWIPFIKQIPKLWIDKTKALFR